MAGMNELNWKKAHKKQYDIYVSMPEKGTVVINKLEQSDSARILNGHTWITPQQMEKNPQVKNLVIQLLQAGKAYLVDNAHPFVLAGTVGEFWTIKPDQLASKYMFLSEGKPTAINQETLNKRLKNGILDWTQIRSNPETSEVYACFVPTSQRGQVQSSYAVLQYNAPYVKHGKGDFLIARHLLSNGQPDTSRLSVVNGLVFRDTYDNRGWGDCLDTVTDTKGVTIDDLPKVIPHEVAKKDMGYKGKAEEEALEIIHALRTALANIFLTEGFDIGSSGDNAIPSITQDGRATCRFIVKERDKSSERGTVLYLSLEGKNVDTEKESDIFSIKAVRDGKELNKKFKFAGTDENSLARNFYKILIVSYLEFCKLFKMTPFRFITKPRYIQSLVHGHCTYLNEGMFMRADFIDDAFMGKASAFLSSSAINNKYYMYRLVTNSYKANTVSTASASCDFSFDLWGAEMKQNTQGATFSPIKQLSTYPCTLAVKLDNKLLEETIRNLDGFDGQFKEGTFDIKLKVSNSSYINVPLERIFNANSFCECIMAGVVIERMRQSNSNAVQKEKPVDKWVKTIDFVTKEARKKGITVELKDGTSVSTLNFKYPNTNDLIWMDFEKEHSCLSVHAMKPGDSDTYYDYGFGIDGDSVNEALGAVFRLCRVNYH